ncbi:Succinylglutamic semialdehyde dehydrogenase [Salmonella enterica subsp. enterica serovar Inverness str. R8-3668]|uniref:Succinylglutamic semialdehyde dehydrogenase n=1 Tax=Salmonella enterica subsp. enterica serovar Inverness str. R8-3668 TaxID=913075 RepID=G5NDZ5_SALET|nr:Succinylglutamic semialdehyde dehydrogenase [Salmonella enterica subsp. enterica serovar Inverness str. R8-3668]
MTLWINGDWITGQGERRRKTNPVSAEILWQGNDANAAQVAEACQAARARARRFLVGPSGARGVSSLGQTAFCGTTGYRREICRPAGGA